MCGHSVGGTLALLAAMLVALWVGVARARAQRESPGDPALDALRQRKLVRRRSSSEASGSEAVDVVELDPDDPPEPSDSTPAQAGRSGAN